MKSVRIIFFAAVVLFLCDCPTSAVPIVLFNDGLTHDIDYRIDSCVYVDYHTPYKYTTINVLDGGSIVYGLLGYEQSRINVSGGFIGMDLIVGGSSQVNISGGIIGNKLASEGSSQVDISGGSISWLLLSNQSMIQIFGSDFLVDGQPFGYGELTSIDGGDWRDGQLAGTLLSGELIDAHFRIGQNARIVLIPEPASVMLLGLGGFFLRRRRR